MKIVVVQAHEVGATTSKNSPHLWHQSEVKTASGEKPPSNKCGAMTGQPQSGGSLRATPVTSANHSKQALAAAASAQSYEPYERLRSYRSDHNYRESGSLPFQGRFLGERFDLEKWQALRRSLNILRQARTQLTRFLSDPGADLNVLDDKLNSTLRSPSFLGNLSALRA